MVKILSHKNRSYLVTFIFIILALLSIAQLWHYYMQSPWTRDGRVRAHIIRIMPEVSAPIVAVHIKDNQYVKKGTLMLELDPKPYKIALEQAQAYLKTRQLIKNASTESSELALALEHDAELKLKQAIYQLEKTKIYAPVDGYVTNLSSYLGGYAVAHEAIITLIDEHSFYINGYFLETQLSKVSIDSAVTITLLGQEKYPLTGRVQSISRGVDDDDSNSSAQGLSRVRPAFDWIRSAQRIPVRIEIIDRPSEANLVVGMSCSLAVHANKITR